MDHPTQPLRPREETRRNNRLKYTFDGRFSPHTPPDTDASETTESNRSDAETRQSSESGYSDPGQRVGLAASIQLIANTMLRMELAELEMMKKREAARLEAQRRQAELEDEMTRMMLQTQSYIASFLSHNGPSRKRKSSVAEDNPSSSRTNTDGALVLTLPHCNTI